MGALKDKANEQSKFLVIEKRSYAVVRYIDFRFVPSQRDPSLEVVQYRVNENGKEKFWTNGSSAVMRTMDAIPKGSWVKISRNPWVSKEGKEDLSKSSYVVEEIDDLKEPRSSAPSGSQETKKNKKTIKEEAEEANPEAWDE